MLEVHIEKRFAGFSLRADFAAGNETMALLGASGAGKTMTLRCIAGIVKPDRGSITVDGRVWFDAGRGVNLPPQERGVGLLFQSYALFPNMSVRQNLLCGLRHDTPRRHRAREVERLLSAFCLEGLGQRFPGELSGGQQQRVALARCLARKPSLLLLDEPFAALDTHLRWRLEQELKATLDGFAGTALYVTHDRDETRRLCQRVCVMWGGRTQTPAPVSQWYHMPQTRSAALLAGFENVADAYALPAGGMRMDEWAAQWPCGCEGVTAVAFRAEDTRLTATQEEFAIHCRIVRTTEQETICEPLGRANVLLRARPEGRFAVGDEVWLCVSPEQVVCLKQEE